MNYFIVFDTVKGAYLALNSSNKGFLTYLSPQEACSAFNRNDYSASALLNWVSLNPFVIALPQYLKPLEVLELLSASSNPDLRVYSLSSNSARHIKGAKVDLGICRKYEVSRVQFISS